MFTFLVGDVQHVTSYDFSKVCINVKDFIERNHVKQLNFLNRSVVTTNKEIKIAHFIADIQIQLLFN